MNFLIYCELEIIIDELYCPTNVQNKCTGYQAQNPSRAWFCPPVFLSLILWSALLHEKCRNNARHAYTSDGNTTQTSCLERGEGQN